jgi:hypothetical protein
VATHPAFRCGRRSSQSSAPKGATPRLLARFPGSALAVLLAQGPVLQLVRIRGGDFRPVKASETFCVLVAYTELQKVLRGSKEAKAMRFAVQPNG